MIEIDVRYFSSHTFYFPKDTPENEIERKIRSYVPNVSDINDFTYEIVKN